MHELQVLGLYCVTVTFVLLIFRCPLAQKHLGTTWQGPMKVRVPVENHSG